jgi:hypothetical protein
MGLPTVEFFISGFVSTLRQLIGHDFRPTRIDFSFLPPQHMDAYTDTFQTQLLFDQEITAIIFDRKFLDLPTPKPVSIVNEILSKVVETHLRASEKKFYPNMHPCFTPHSDDLQLKSPRNRTTIPAAFQLQIVQI